MEAMRLEFAKDEISQIVNDQLKAWKIDLGQNEEIASE
jgi:hypothetical protein